MIKILGMPVDTQVFEDLAHALGRLSMREYREIIALTLKGLDEEAQSKGIDIWERFTSPKREMNFEHPSDGNTNNNVDDEVNKIEKMRQVQIYAEVMLAMRSSTIDEAIAILPDVLLTAIRRVEERTKTVPSETDPTEE